MTSFSGMLISWSLTVLRRVFVTIVVSVSGFATCAAQTHWTEAAPMNGDMLTDNRHDPLPAIACNTEGIVLAAVTQPYWFNENTLAFEPGPLVLARSTNGGATYGGWKALNSHLTCRGMVYAGNDTWLLIASELLQQT